MLELWGGILIHSIQVPHFVSNNIRKSKISEMDSLENSGLLTETYLQLRITNEVSESICMYLVTVLLLQRYGALTILYHH